MAASAEDVQSVLDSMVSPLKDLLDRGVFSEVEIRAIVERRRQSEYLLRRRTPRKADFIHYLEQELQLENLRKLRMKSNKGAVVTNTNNNNHVGNGDKHIVRHIHSLFSRTLRKFKSDVSLYLQYIDFCKSTKSYKTLTKVYGQALRMHSRNAGLWIDAASYEFFSLHNVDNARVVFQRSLRINPTSEQLWIQYFTMELHYIQKLRGRQQVLLSQPQPQKQQQHNVTTTTTTTMTSSESDNNNDDDENDDTTTTTDNNMTNNNDNIPMVIYNNAIQTIPNHSVVFRLQFLDQCRMFPSSTTTSVIERHVVQTMARDFGNDVDAWIARAAYYATNNRTKEHNVKEEEEHVGFVNVVEEDEEQHQDPAERRRASKRQKTTTNDDVVDENDDSHPVIKVLEEAIETLPTADMYVKSIQFLRRTYNVMTTNNEKDQDDNVVDVDDVQCMNFVYKLFRKAKEHDIASSELVLEEADILCQEGKLSDAIDVLKKFAMSSSSSSSNSMTEAMYVSVWTSWAKLLFASTAAGSDDECCQKTSSESASRILRIALDRTPMYNSKEQMMILLELFGALLMEASSNNNNNNSDDGTNERHDYYKSELNQLFERMLLVSAGTSTTAPFSDDDDYNDCVFGVESIAAACVQYLRFTVSSFGGGTEAARRVYEQVLYRSNYGTASGERRLGTNEQEHMKQFFDECLQLETGDETKKATKQKRQRLGRLYAAAVAFFDESNPSLADSYRSQRDSNVRFA